MHWSALVVLRRTALRRPGSQNRARLHLRKRSLQRRMAARRHKPWRLQPPLPPALKVCQMVLSRLLPPHQASLTPALRRSGRPCKLRKTQAPLSLKMRLVLHRLCRLQARPLQL